VRVDFSDELVEFRESIRMMIEEQHTLAQLEREVREIRKAVWQMVQLDIDAAIAKIERDIDELKKVASISSNFAGSD
jgi:hypothetical protein